ncbi:hypothetical protein Aperf_G00000018540 [Anoplocephala perfoliata]
MDARLKFRHLKLANVKAMDEKIAQINNDSIAVEEKLSHLARSRESMRAKQMYRAHFVIWLDAWRKLQDSAQNLQSDLQSSVYRNADLNLIKWDSSGSSLSQMVNSRNQDLDSFINGVIRPLNQLRSEVKSSVQPNESLQSSLHDAYAKIKDESFKLLQLESEIIDFLPISRLNTFRQLHIGDSVEDRCGGIPREAWEWITHNEAFKADLLSEFVHLDSIYIAKIKNTKMDIMELEKLYNLSQWKVDEFMLAEYIWDVYNSSNIPRKRQGCLDLLNHIPSLGHGKSHAQLLDLFRVHDLMKMKLEDIMLAWTRARQELTDRIHVTLEDALAEHHRRNEEKANVEAQRPTCLQLTEKVKKWRREKAELEELEFRAKEAKRDAELAREKEKQEREDKRRREIKYMLQRRKETQLRQKAEFEAAERLRLEELRRVFDRQRRHDTRRLLEIAKARLREQKARRSEAIEEAAKQVEAAEAHLEAIRSKVRPTIPDDPCRLFANTESWRHYLEASMIIQGEKETKSSLNLSNPTAKPITTFTEDQLQQDRRTRLSAALFEAGLLNSIYARNLLAQVPLPRQAPPLLQISQSLAPTRPARRPPPVYRGSDIFFTRADPC